MKNYCQLWDSNPGPTVYEVKVLTLSYEYKKRLLLRCIHHFKSDWINNMDHMRISGTEPSSVIEDWYPCFKNTCLVSSVFSLLTCVYSLINILKITENVTHVYVCEVNWLFNVTINDISVIYVTAHRCPGGLKKKLDLRSYSKRHRYFVGFFNVPVQAPTWVNLFILLLYTRYLFNIFL